MIEKPKRVRDVKYRAWIKKCHCYACIYELYHQKSMEKNVDLSIINKFETPQSDPHHVHSGKNDHKLIPLCRNFEESHHSEIESWNMSKPEFYKKYGIVDIDLLADMYYEKYLKEKDIT